MTANGNSVQCIKIGTVMIPIVKQEPTNDGPSDADIGVVSVVETVEMD